MGIKVAREGKVKSESGKIKAVHGSTAACAILFTQPL